MSILTASLGPFSAFLYGWAAFAVMQTGSIAAVAYVFAEYAGHFVPLPEFSPSIATWTIHLRYIGDVAPFKEIGTKGLAAALIILLTAINYIGVRFGRFDSKHFYYRQGLGHGFV